MEYDRGDSFLIDFKQLEFNSVHNQKENCHHDQIPSNLEGNGNIFSRFYMKLRRTTRLFN